MDNLSRHGGHFGSAFHAVSLAAARRLTSATSPTSTDQNRYSATSALRLQADVLLCVHMPDRCTTIARQVAVTTKSQPRRWRPPRHER